MLIQRAKLAVSILLFLCTVAVLLISPAAVTQKITLRYSTWQLGDSLEEHKLRASMFEKLHPNISIKVESFAGTDYSAKLLTLYAAGMAPDVMHMGLHEVDTYIESGMLYDVTPFVRESGFDFDKYWPFAPICKRGDRIWGGLETHFQVYPLYYNVDLFDLAALQSPNDYYKQNKWDWATFLQVAKKLTKDTNGDGKVDQYGFYISGGWEGGWYPWVLLQGGSFVSPERDRVTIDSPEAVKALEFYIGLIWKHGVAPKPGTVSFSPDPFAAQVTAMHLAGSWGLKRYQPGAEYACDFSWDIAHPPKGVQFATDREAGFIGLVSSQTKHPKEAWEFVKFLLGTDCQMIFARSRLCQPMLKSVYQAPEYRRTPPEHISVIPQMIQYSIPLPTFSGARNVLDTIDRELRPAFNGTMEPMIAAQKAAVAANAVLKQFASKK